MEMMFSRAEDCFKRCGRVDRESRFPGQASKIHPQGGNNRSYRDPADIERVYLPILGYPPKSRRARKRTACWARFKKRNRCLASKEECRHRYALNNEEAKN